MAKKEPNDINKEEFNIGILNAPKIKFKIPTVYPTPFSLNNSYDEEDLDTRENTENSFDESESNTLN